MYCYNCGKELLNEDIFCQGCGATQEQPTNAQPADAQPMDAQPFTGYAPQYEPQMPPKAQRKSRKWIWISAISVAVVIAAALIVYFLFFRTAAPLLMVGRAFANIGDEVNERFDNSPFKALTMLAEILEDGTITADFDYRANILGGVINEDIEGRFKLSSNSDKREFALEAEGGLFGESLNLDVYMNRERLALRADILDDRFYGITYNTFREDIRGFGRMLFLDDETMDMLADIVDGINEMMNEEEVDDDAFEDYINIFSEFLKYIKVSSGRARIESGGEQIRCTRVSITVSKGALLELLNDLYDVLENDERVRAQFDMQASNPLTQETFGGYTSYEQWLRDFNQLIRDIKRYYEGDIILQFFVGGEDRLLLVDINADITYDETPEGFRATFDFGNSIEDTWAFDFSIFSGNNRNDAYVTWDYNVQMENYANTIYASGDNIEPVTLISDWNKNNGDFVISYNGGGDTGAVNGVFTTEERNFRLILDNVLPASSDSTFKIDILAETGSFIGDIDYINIDKWGYELVGSIMRLLLGGVFS